MRQPDPNAISIEVKDSVRPSARVSVRDGVGVRIRVGVGVGVGVRLRCSLWRLRSRPHGSHLTLNPHS